jgi:hypothetical protein
MAQQVMPGDPRVQLLEEFLARHNHHLRRE